jgi:hypothetical protein
VSESTTPAAGDGGDSAGKRQAMPRDCWPIPAVNPEGGNWEIYVRNAAMDRAVKIGPGAVRELGFILPEAVLKPTAVFRGVRDEGEAEWLCYVSRPSRSYDGKDNSRPALRGKASSSSSMSTASTSCTDGYRRIRKTPICRRTINRATTRG